MKDECARTFIASDPKHKYQMKAIEMIANRTGLPEVEQIEIKHTNLTGEALVERITALATKLGFDPAKVLGGNLEVPKLIEAQSVEVVEQNPATFPEWCGLRKTGE